MKKDDSKPADPKAKVESVTEKIARLEKEILKEAEKITNNEVMSCFTLCEKTKELMKARSEK